MDFTKFNVFELKEQLRRRKCVTSGKKEDLLERLIKCDEKADYQPIPSNTRMSTRTQTQLKKKHPKMRSLRIQIERLSEATIKSYLNGTHSKLKPVENPPKKSSATSMNVTSIESEPKKTENKNMKKKGDPIDEPIGKKRRVDLQPERRVLRSATNIENQKINEPVKKNISTSQNQQLQRKESQSRKCRKSRQIVMNIIIMQPALIKYEMVWARVRGYAFWPGILEEETKKGKFKIHFFGDYTTSVVGKSKILHFMEGFSGYARQERPTITLHKAVEEARYFLFQKTIPTSCFLCDLLALKQRMNTNARQIREN